METTKILAGVIAATVMNLASASSATSVKQEQAVVMKELLQGVTVVMARPECSIKHSIWPI